MQTGDKTTLLNLVYAGIQPFDINNDNAEGLWKKENKLYTIKADGFGYVVQNVYEVKHD